MKGKIEIDGFTLLMNLVAFYVGIISGVMYIFFADSILTYEPITLFYSGIGGVILLNILKKFIVIK